MLLHNLLEKQIKEFLPHGSESNPELKQFINSINGTYETLHSDKTPREGDFVSKQQTIFELEKSEEKYKSILEKSADIIYKTNRDGYFTFVNPVAERITEFSEDELLNTHFLELIREDYRKMANSIYGRQTRFKKSTTYLEFPIVTKTGLEKWIGQSVQYTELGDSDFELTALAIDITERKASEKTILLREEKYRNIIANVNMGLVEVDLNEVIQHCNQGFCDLSGYTRQELIGKNIVDILVCESSKSLLKNKTQQRSSGLSDSYEIEIKNKKGFDRWWLVSGAPNYDDSGKLIGSVGIHLDITERKRLEQELKAAKQKAEESSKAKEVFLANMSHEIRTPLNAIIGMIRELSFENLTEVQNVYVRNTSIASQHLLSILNNILDISKIEAGEFKLQETDFEIEALLYSATEMMKNSAADKNLHLKTSFSKDLKKVLRGDATRLRQILINILGNAIKFTEHGGISLKCEVERETSSEQMLLISVTDTGVGMSKDYQKNIFNKFSQEDATTARIHGGTGLGMAITRELIQLMQGDITIDSTKGVGTTVLIKLALLVGDSSKISELNPKKTFTKKPIKVLLTEDNEFNRFVATKTLNRNNCIVSTAVNGLEAIEKLKKDQYDIVLMDVQMPVMDGIEATKLIRTKLKLTTPIIALSANAFKSESDFCLKIGMNDYITKPFEEKFLMDSIYKNINKPLEESDYVVNTSQTKKLYNISELRQLSDGDDNYMKTLVNLFIKQSKSSVKQITEALVDKDLKKVYEISHQIKPSIENFNIDRLKLAIREIEDDSKAGIYSKELKQNVTFLCITLKKVIYGLQFEFNLSSDEEDIRPLYEYQP
ncbi:PAS domain S-box protein [Aurantibacillus circumpalustris]|uniref:PAS domain S-box protein n=1 Tax=Aurantibacillus circumpalustris TaxID=3036359 RepID=UPI00295B5BE7|nr:PAS domain S-box protein [Aurantibacillus circumpalustris]